MVMQERPRSHARAAAAALWLRPAPCRPTNSCSAQDIRRPAALDLCRCIPLKRGWFQAHRLLCEVHEDFQLNMTLAAHGYWVCPLPRKCLTPTMLAIAVGFSHRSRTCAAGPVPLQHDVHLCTLFP